MIDALSDQLMLCTCRLKQDTKLVAILSSGEVFTDEESKVRITVVSTNGIEGAVVALSTCLGVASTTTPTTAAVSVEAEQRVAESEMAAEGSAAVSAAVACSAALDRFSVGTPNTRGHPDNKIFQGRVGNGEEGCGAACIANAECTGFAFSWRSQTCRLYKTTTNTIINSGSNFFVRDDHCAGGVEEQKAQCLAFTPFKARPLCGRSAKPGGEGECCDGTQCLGRKNNKGVKIFRCDIKVARKSQKIGETCTVNKHCRRGLKCDTDRFVCYDKKVGIPDVAPSSRLGRSVANNILDEQETRVSSATNALAYAFVAFGLVSVGTVFGAVVIRGQKKKGACSTATVPTMDGSVFALMHSIEIVEDEPAIYDFKTINKELVF
jgi:hypothetical protein